MNVMKSLPQHGLGEIEMLLPWYAAGTLSGRDAKAVERALAHDARLAEQYAAIEREYAAIVDLNESLGAPSTRAMAKLFASIDEEGTRRSFGIPTWDNRTLARALVPRRGLGRVPAGAGRSANAPESR